MASALVLRCWIFFFNFKGKPVLILQKNVFPLSESKLLVMREGIVEALQHVCEVLLTA
jgi:hypothetical protein